MLHDFVIDKYQFVRFHHEVFEQIEFHLNEKIIEIKFFLLKINFLL